VILRGRADRIPRWEGLRSRHRKYLITHVNSGLGCRLFWAPAYFRTWSTDGGTSFCGSRRCLQPVSGNDGYCWCYGLDGNGNRAAIGMGLAGRSVMTAAKRSLRSCAMRKASIPRCWFTPSSCPVRSNTACARVGLALVSADEYRSWADPVRPESPDPGLRTAPGGVGYRRRYGHGAALAWKLFAC
jgi:hypothetical protein